MNFDSKEELYFSWWLDELIEAGLCVDYMRGVEFELSEPVKRVFEKKLKTKTKLVEKHLLGGHIYTPDFAVSMSLDMGNRCGFYCKAGHYFVEVKGDYDSNNMTRLFTINQKWVYDKYGILVNLVKIPSFFKKTFTPARYLLTDQTMKPRKLKYKPRTLKQFMEEI